MHLVAWAVPVFFMMIFLELWISMRQGRLVYRPEAMIADLSCGIGSQVVWLATKLGIYAVLYDQFRLLTWQESSTAVWWIGIVGYDFLFYFWHRSSHRVNLLWAAHAVHHQSEDFNLAVALRQGWLEEITSLMFHLALALVGVPPLTYAAARGVSLLYQFLLHTQLVGSFGRLEGFFNTPSAHRVHHGINPQYIDKNFGAIFTVWDRIFGTYEREGEKVRYGVTEQLRSYNPFWANFAEWWRLKAAVARAPGVMHAVRVLFGSPDTLLKDHGPSWGSQTLVKYNPSLPTGLLPYVAVQLLVVSTVTTCVMFWWEEMSVTLATIACVWVLTSVLVWSGLSERQTWAPWLEAVRLLLTGVFLFGAPLPITSSSPVTWLASTFAMFFLFWFVRLMAAPGSVTARAN